ncbi:MAG: hypothetical protein ACP5OH_06225 [Nitrososphaerota archaeon]
MVEFEFGFHRFRLHNKHNNVVNPTSGRENWTICHRDEHDEHKRHLFFYGIAGDKFNIMTFYQPKALVKYGDHLILFSN